MLRARGAKSLRVLMDCRKVADFNRRDAVNRSSRGLLSQCFGCCQSPALERARLNCAKWEAWRRLVSMLNPSHGPVS